MNRASCLCGDVVWETDAALEAIHHCHCSRCRKAHGAPFVSYAECPAGDLRLRNRERIVRWESSPGWRRGFCGRCGSAVPGDAFGGLVFIPAGNFDGDPGARPVAHVFAASKVPWLEIVDGLPAFDAFPPGFDAPTVEDRRPLDPPGRPRGSCLCGAATYIVEGAPLRAMHCHCSRCRKARSAAHASNLFTTAAGVRFTRGEDRLESYKLPGARFFMQVFCRTCGSPMPRIDRDRDLAVVPMGTLDDDPGMRPQGHIFVGSKAPWYTIADALPRHAEYPPSA